MVIVELKERVGVMKYLHLIRILPNTCSTNIVYVLSIIEFCQHWVPAGCCCSVQTQSEE